MDHARGRGWYHATIELITDHARRARRRPANARAWHGGGHAPDQPGPRAALLRGYTGEVEDAYLEALALFEDRPGEPRRLFPVLRGLASFYGYRGEFERGIEIIHEILRLAESRTTRACASTG